jgi:hypothetical protein
MSFVDVAARCFGPWGDETTQALELPEFNTDNFLSVLTRLLAWFRQLSPLLVTGGCEIRKHPATAGPRGVTSSCFRRLLERQLSVGGRRPPAPWCTPGAFMTSDCFGAKIH